MRTENCSTQLPILNIVLAPHRQHLSSPTTRALGRFLSPSSGFDTQRISTFIHQAEVPNYISHSKNKSHQQIVTQNYSSTLTLDWHFQNQLASSSITDHRYNIMDSRNYSTRYGTNAWNNEAARNNLDKHLANPSVKDGKIIKPVKANTRSSLSSNVHGMSINENSESNIHHTHLDYDHSKSLTSAGQSYCQAATSGTVLGKSNASKVSQKENARPKSSKVGKAETPARPQEAPKPPYTVNYKTENESKPEPAPAQWTEDRISGGFEAAQWTVVQSQATTKTSAPPHLRVPTSGASSQGTSKTTTPASTLAHLRALPSVGSSQPISKLALPTPALAEQQKLAWAKPEDRDQGPIEIDTTEPSIPMKSCAAAKSAGKDSSFPCSYSDCGLGFSSARRLKKHKEAKHDWCSVCNIDCEDDVALIEHRKASTLAGEGKHIACLKCGDDFGCEAGRDRHTRQVSQLYCHRQ